MKASESGPTGSKKTASSSKKASGKSMAPADNAKAAPSSDRTDAGVSKPKRVRTGCLTCRERHLKCDEGLPTCQNCRKSNRQCKRGVRLNFIDTQVKDTQIIPPTADWNVGFRDESREIASEYKGGAGRYAEMEDEPMGPSKNEASADTSSSMLNAPIMAHQQLPPIQSVQPGSGSNYSDTSSGRQDPGRESHTHHQHRPSTDSTYSSHTMQSGSQVSYAGSDQTLQAQEEVRDCLTSPEETLFMQVFVEEVGLWMDSMDPKKHVSLHQTQNRFHF